MAYLTLGEALHRAASIVFAQSRVRRARETARSHYRKALSEHAYRQIISERERFDAQQEAARARVSERTMVADRRVSVQGVLGLALALALAIPASAFAATGSSPETLASVVTITLNGVPASLDYGTVSPAFTGTKWNGGATGTTGAGIAASAFAITFGADSGTPATLTASGGTLTGPATIAASNRRICKVSTVGGNSGVSGTCGTDLTNMAAPQTISSQTAAGVNAVATINVGWQLTTPAAGTYTGTVVFTAQ